MIRTAVEIKLRPRMQRAVDELQNLIRAGYPEATFRVVRNPDDSRGIDLLAIADHEQMDDVLDLVIDRVMEFQIEQHLPIHVIPLRPIRQIGSSDPVLDEERGEAQPVTASRA